MSGLQGEFILFFLLTKSRLVFYLALGVVRKQKVDQAIAHCGHHIASMGDDAMSLDHINTKNATTSNY